MSPLAMASAQTLSHSPGPAWPQAHGALKPDPGVLFGVLPNGMRYAIKKNPAPTGQVSIRLRVAAGSMDETDSEQGLAHFLEHMTFRGSKKLPDGQILKTLQSMGLSLQADLNAQTEADQTVFKFDLPANDPGTIEKALLLTREIASDATIAPAAVDSERSVVLAELHQRDTPALHMQKADLALALGNRVADALMPIGTAADVQAATAQQLRSFYNAYYRPDRTTLLIVGDVDPKAVARQIKARFSDWAASAPEPQPSAYSVVPATAPRFTTFSEPGAASVVSLIWAVPHNRAPDSIAQERRELIRLVGLTVLNQRLRTLAQSDNAPFIAAGARWSPLAGVADVTEIDAPYRAGGALTALRALQSAYLNVVHNGVRQDEVNEAVNSLRAFFQSQVAAAGTIPSSKLATALLANIDQDQVITAPDQDLALYQQIVQNLTASSVSTALKSVFTTASPSVFVSDTTPLPGGKAAIETAFNQGAAVQGAPSAPSAATAWPYTSFGPEGRVVSRKTVADLGTTFVTFANGVEATIKPTTFQKGQVLVAVRFGDGRLGLPKSHPSPVWAANGALMLGSLKRISLDGMEKALAGKVVNGSLGVEDDAFVLKGTTRPADFDTELQLLAAYITDPAWQPQGFLRIQAAMASALQQLDSTPDGVLKLRYNQIVHDNDPRWSPPTADAIRTATADGVKALLQAPLAHGPLNVIVVGDISVANAIDSIKVTFGALPPRPAPATGIGDEHLSQPITKPTTFIYDGKGSQVLAAIGWPTVGDFPDMQMPQTLRVLSQVLELRLFDELRTREGVTYTPQTKDYASLLTPSFGYIAAFAEIPTQNVGAFYATVESIAENLAKTRISEAELARARAPLVDDLRHQQQTNDYWIKALADAEVDSRRLDLVRSVATDLKRVTAADVQTVARRYLASSRAWKVVIEPKVNGEVARMH